MGCVRFLEEEEDEDELILVESLEGTFLLLPELFAELECLCCEEDEEDEEMEPLLEDEWWWGW